VGAGRNRCRWGEHCSVLTRPVGALVLAHRTRWYGDHPDRPGTRLPGAPFPRIATTCTVQLAAGPVVQLTNTHLDSSSAERRVRSARQLLSWLDGDLPQVVLGDFNAGPGDEVLEILNAGGLRHALPATAGGTFHRFTGRTDGARIDHVLVSDGVDVLAAEVRHQRVGARLASDHWPVVADLRVQVPTR
jgi:endonuclease/exonuclease/phosphatase family metal-dependent hydrolase